jgi:hypothetical protein
MFLRRVESYISEKEIRKSLNIKPPSPESYARFLEKFLNSAIPDPSLHKYRRAVLREWTEAANREVGSRQSGFVLNYLARAPSLELPPAPPGQGWQMPETFSLGESDPMRDALISSHLRRFVDPWLDTGRSADGKEFPGNRNLLKAPYSHDAVMEYLEKCPVSIMPKMNDQRGFSFQAASPRWGTGVRDFFQSMLIEAKRLFTGLIVSDFQDRLCKCRYSICGCYFFLPKPLLRPRNAGLFCAARHHRLSVAAMKTDEKRRSGHSALVDYAAQQLVNRKVASGWKDDTTRKAWLASKMTSYLVEGCRDPELRAYRQQVKVNWVTRNRDEIERRRLELNSVHSGK